MWKEYKVWWLVACAGLLVWVMSGCGAVVSDVAEAGGETPPAERVETAVPTPLPTALPPIPTAPAPATPTRLPTTTPAPLPTLPSPLIVNPVDADMEQTAVAQGVALHVVDSTNSGVWQYPQDTFIQPVSLATWQTDAFLLDAGRLLRLHLAEPQAAEVLLQAGDVVEGVTVIEPLALHPAPDGLLVLDRAGDVYRYEWATAAWRLDRYDRPISDTSSHYYTALSGVGNGRYLLETSYKYVLLYEDGVQQSLWNLPELRGVDVAAAGESVYVLGQSMDDTSAVLLRYENTSTVAAFQPDVALDQARDVVAGETAVYVLDQNGKRLLAFSPESGKLQALYQLPAQDAISAIALLPGSETLLLAGRNRLFFLEQPERSANLPGVPLLTDPQPHDPQLLAAITGFAPPIGWDLTSRDLQMPGAPRHYRLGVHEGADFYWARDAQVLAAADGVVIRALHDYVPPFPAAFYEIRINAHELGYTSEEALDFYRGRQVWLQHENGLVSRYVHLGGIDWSVVEGETVTQGQIIGTVGNSGSPASLDDPDSDAHLHFELWLGDHYLGQFMRPVQTRDWFNTILHQRP